MCKKLWLSEAIIKYGVKFQRGRINIVNSHAGSGKSYFIYNELMKNPNKYIDVRENPKFLYVTDTSALKDSIIYDLNIDVTAKRRMIDKFNDERGNVYTYSGLADICARNPQFLKSFDVIICDELQNLYKYSKQHGNNYPILIHYLEGICKTNIVIGLSATPRQIFQYSERNNSKVNYYRIFNPQQLKTVRDYNMDMKPMHDVFNFIKTYDFNEIPSEKIVIHVNRISTAKSIQDWLTDKGIKAIYLSSKSAHDNAIYESEKKSLTDEEAIKLERKKMTDEQIRFRDELLTDKIADDGTSTRGQLQNYRVLILTSAYETGINIYDKNVGIVLVASSDRDYYIQARSRVRHDIRQFFVYPPNGFEDLADDFSNIPPRIDNKYFNVAIDKFIKEELISQYGLVLLGKERTNFKSVEEYFGKHGYVFETINKEFKLFHSKEEKEEEEMTVKEVEVDEIKKYLDTIIDIRLFKEQQEELISVINLRDNRNRQQKSVGSLNSYLQDNYQMQLISKKVKVKGKKVTVWEVSNM